VCTAIPNTKASLRMGVVVSTNPTYPRR
jgi:hypothetical protein